MADNETEPALVTLVANEMELVLSPEIGGSVISFTGRGHQILRSAPASCRDPKQMAAFPLIPFSGRIQDGAFSFDGRAITLPPNMPPERHAIHGQGWQMPWHISKQSQDSITLTVSHAAGDWPWQYSAEQTFTLLPDTLHVALSIINKSDRLMPAGLGWHPYFPRGDAQLTCDVTGYWPNTDDYVPGNLLPPTGQADLQSPKPVDDLTLDNAFRGGAAGARIDWSSRKLCVEITSSEALNHWIVYTPAGEDFFCVEPVSHAPNALNMAPAPDWADMQRLAPGEKMTAETTLTIINR